MKEEFAEYRVRRMAELEARLAALPEGPYALELGCGHGHFLTARAEENSALENREAKIENGGAEAEMHGTAKVAGKLHFVGVDKNPERLARAKKKSERAGVAIEWVEARVADVVERWPEGRELREVWVLFPDPWPREKQWKHRFVNAGLLERLAKHAAKGARLYFRTDHEGYFEAVRELLKENRFWRESAEEKWPEGLPATVFEGHHPVYRELVAVKR